MHALFETRQWKSVSLRCSCRILTFAIVLPLACERVSAFEDDTVLCEGWSQESYYRKLSQQSFEQYRMNIEYQNQLAYQAAVQQKAIEAEQKALEKIYLARRARFAEAARRREELKAQREAAKPRTKPKTASGTSTTKPLLVNK